MSRLQELLDQYCPNGVEWKPVKEVASIVRGVRITKKQLVAGGKYIVISGGTTPMGRYNECNRQENTITIASYGTAGYVDYIKEPFWANDVCLTVLPNDFVDNKYLYYALKSHQEYLYEHVIDAVPAHIPTAIIENMLVPVPSIEVQREIVRILDSFTELTTELTTELAARRKQYEYYRDTLLDFDNADPNSWLGKMMAKYCPDGVEYKPLSSISEYARDKIDASGVDEFTYVGVDNLLPEKCGKTTSDYVPEEGRLIRFVKNDVLIGNIRPYLKKIWLAEHDGGTNGDVLVVHILNDDIDPKFLYYCLSSDQFFLYDTQHSRGSKMPRGDKSAVMSYVIPVPPLELQREIVKVLDRFSSLCSDISSGLPAEIAARQKQYEYYRDRLLSF